MENIEPTKEFQEYHIERVFYLVSILEQVLCLIDELYREKKSIEEQKNNAKIKTETKRIKNGFSFQEEVPIILTTKYTALKSSILLFQFNFIESFCYLISDLTLKINDGKYYQSKGKLSGEEIALLSEKKYLINGNNHQKKVNGYFSLEDRIIKYPKLFAKINNVQFKLDTSKHFWSYFKNYKKIRDALSHPKENKLNIKENILFETTEFCYWYSKEIFILLKECLYSNEDNYPYKLIEKSLIKMIINLFHCCENIKIEEVNDYLKEHQKLFKK